MLKQMPSYHPLPLKAAFLDLDAASQGGTDYSDTKTTVTTPKTAPPNNQIQRVLVHLYMRVCELTYVYTHTHTRI